MLHLVFKVSSTCLQPHTQLIVFSAFGQRTANRSWCRLVCRQLDVQTFTSLIPALKWMVIIIETYCLREIFCPILNSTRITSHFSKTEPQRIGLAKLSNSWKSRRLTSFHKNVATQQPRSQPSGLQDLGHRPHCKNGFTKQAVRMSTSYDAGLLRIGMGQAWPRHNW